MQFQASAFSKKDIQGHLVEGTENEILHRIPAEVITAGARVAMIFSAALELSVLCFTHACCFHLTVSPKRDLSRPCVVLLHGLLHGWPCVVLQLLHLSGEVVVP